jgi:hypothetical protein
MKFDTRASLKSQGEMEVDRAVKWRVGLQGITGIKATWKTVSTLKK